MLDENIDSIQVMPTVNNNFISPQAISIFGIHSLLVLSTEERFVSVFSNGSCGFYLPSLAPPIAVESAKEDTHDIIQSDVIKGLLKMMLLPRLRYILEVCYPQDAVVTNILEILIRVARHSLQSAHEVRHLTRHYV